jgi:hypothetical protein
MNKNGTKMEQNGTGTELERKLTGGGYNEPKKFAKPQKFCKV